MGILSWIIFGALTGWLASQLMGRDETRIPLAALALAGWTVFWIMATVRVIARGVAKTKQMQVNGKGV